MQGINRMLFNDVCDLEFVKNNKEIIDLLLFDQTTKKPIIWATDNYKKRGQHYFETDHITSNLIYLKNKKVIKPRIEKSKAEQTKRSKDNAEVFTPSWICNKQNNLVDEAWFGKTGVFNIENQDNSWKPTERVVFDGDKDWKEYVSNIRLEMCCGEAPYLVSRYDTVTGNELEIKDRVGLLDRKLRVINENAASDDEWFEQSIVALKSIYGYEFQGDNLYIARCNILLTFVDYYLNRFNKEPDIEIIRNIAEIISWNIWQMDGLKLVVPFSCHNIKQEAVQLFLFGDVEESKEEICPGCKNNDVHKHNGKRCYIMDWEANKKVKYVDIMWRGK